MTGKEDRMIARLRVIYSAERDVWVGRRGKYDPMARVERKISEAQDVLDVIDQLEREESATPPVPVPSAEACEAAITCLRDEAMGAGGQWRRLLEDAIDYLRSLHGGGKEKGNG